MKKGRKSVANDAYALFLDEVVRLVQGHRIKAIQSVQYIANHLYWNIGELILKRQAENGWGKAIVEQLSRDLIPEVGEGVSWSPRNLWFMRQLVEEYTILKQPVSELGAPPATNLKQLVSELGAPPATNLKQLVSELDVEDIKQMVSEVPWGHNILILQRVKNPQARLFYLQSTIRNRYSRAVLLHQIKADAYGHALLNPSQHNFAVALPEHLKEQTQETIKSFYILDFLDSNNPLTERQLEQTMVEKVKRLMMELGYGFCFIGNQYRITLGEKEYFIDLLFYHRILKCLVAVELKTVEFEPEFVGKLDFCLQLIDEQLKQPDDKPSIGILLVPYKDQLEVEYALRTASKPIGVAKYSLRKQLPKKLKGKLPTAAELNALMNGQPG